MAGFAELAARSHFSLLDGASDPAELVETAAALGMAGLGLCDVNSLTGAVRGHVAARKAGLAFRVGCRLRLEDGAEWLAWPAGRAGWRVLHPPRRPAAAGRRGAARPPRPAAAARRQLPLPRRRPGLARPPGRPRCGD
jgi:error-prone DNA polymerase